MSFLSHFIRLISLLVVFSSSSVYAQEELLSPDEAFNLAEPVVESKLILLQWNIAPNYYLYKNKMSIVSEQAKFKTPLFNKEAESIEDPSFGITPIFKDTIVMSVPITSSPATFKIKVGYQGCNKPLGVCYPPQSKTFTITPPKQTISDGISSLQSLNNYLVEYSGEELLDVGDAFKFESFPDKNELILSWKVASGYYLYQDKIYIQTLKGDVKFNPAQLPPAHKANDAIFGEVLVYKSDFQAKLPITSISTESTLKITYQGCSKESGVCYPPVHKEITLNPSDFSVAESNTQSQNLTNIPNEKYNTLSESDQITASLQNSSLWVVLGSFFVFGLLLSLTPCVLPMIPILSGIIVGQGKTLTTRKAFMLSVIYVLSMSVAYTVAGVMAGMFGSNLQIALQNPWVLGSFSFIFVLLALSMFGFFKLQLPQFLQTKINNVANKQKGGTVIGVAVMGFLSALIVGPCVAPPLAGALIYIGQTGDALLGGSALFIMSLGMGIPLVLLGTSYGKILPKAGGWMETVNKVFGVLMLAVALWMAERFLPDWLSVLSWSLLLIVSSVYMGAFYNKDSGWFKLFKGFGIAVFIWGVLMLLSIAVGKPSLLEPLSGFKSSNSVQQHTEGLNFKSIKSINDLDKVLSQGRPVMLDFYADWCISCKEMEYKTFRNSKVQDLLKGVTLIQSDVTANDLVDKALMNKFSIVGPPAILFFTPNGKEITSLRVVGFKSPQEFIPILQKFLSKYKND